MSDLNSDKGLETALRELVPGPGNLDRDRLMFRAGQVFAPRRNLLWPAATGVLGVLVMILSILLAAQGLTDSRVRLMPAPLQQPAPMIPPADNSAPPVQRPDSEAAPSYDYDETETPGPMHSRMQQQVMRWGLDALPASPPETGPEVHLPPITVDRAVDSPAAKTPHVADVLRFFQ